MFLTIDRIFVNANPRIEIPRNKVVVFVLRVGEVVAYYLNTLNWHRVYYLKSISFN